MPRKRCIEVLRALAVLDSEAEPLIRRESRALGPDLSGEVRSGVLHVGTSPLMWR